MDDEKIAFERAAELSGESLSSWMRARLRSICTKELKEFGETPEFAKLKKK